MTEQFQFEISIPSRIAEAQAVQERIVQHMEQLTYSMRDIFAIRLAIEEALTNAIRHGNRRDESKQVHVSCQIDTSKLRIAITDDGEGFDPADVPDPTSEEFLERTSGRGILLMRTYMSLCEHSMGGRRITIERERNSPLPKLDD